MTPASHPDPEALTLLALSEAPRFNRWLADTIRPHLSDSILEIGCGIGNLTVELSRGAKRYIASDLNPAYIKKVAARLPGAKVEYASCDLGRKEDLLAFAGCVGTILCLNVLEHVEDDRTGLVNIFSALGKGGRAIVLVPEGAGIFGTLDTALGHHRRYSEAQIKGKMEDAGFMVEHLIGFNRVSRPAWFFGGKVMRQTSLGAAQMRLFDRFVPLWRRIDSKLPWRPLSIIAIGAKR